jgi:hypothetical protein
MRKFKVVFETLITEEGVYLRNNEREHYCYTTTATPEFMHPVVLEINNRQKHNFIKNNK